MMWMEWSIGWNYFLLKQPMKKRENPINLWWVLTYHAQVIRPPWSSPEYTRKHWQTEMTTFLNHALTSQSGELNVIYNKLIKASRKSLWSVLRLKMSWGVFLHFKMIFFHFPTNFLTTHWRKITTVNFQGQQCEESFWSFRLFGVFG